MDSDKQKLIVVLGPTATGKTKLAVALARRFGGEIISADSRQVFRGMDIGTGKDLADYYFDASEGQRTGKKAHSGKDARGSKRLQHVPYQLIDIISPKTAFNVCKYQKLAYKAVEKAVSAGHLPILAGGTGLYIDAVVKGYDFSGEEVSTKKTAEIRKKLDKLSLPQLLSRLERVDPKTYQKIDRANRRRVQRALEVYYVSGKKKSKEGVVGSRYDVLLLGITFPLPELYRRIDARLDSRLKEGMVREIKKLRRQGVSWKRLDEFGLEYRYISRYLRGELSYEEATEKLKQEIHHFAKRQMTWFKRNPDIVWVKNLSQAEKAIKKFLKK